jgi:hypothetical protein
VDRVQLVHIVEYWPHHLREIERREIERREEREKEGDREGERGGREG